MIEKKQYDSDFCGSLPINFINSIQDYGYVFVLEREKLSIIQVSENVGDVLNSSFQQLIGMPFEAIVTTSDFARLKTIFSEKNATRIPLTLSLKHNDQSFYSLIHVYPQHLIIEMEAVDELKGRKFTEVFQEVKNLSGEIEQADSVIEVCNITVKELRKLSGFDGVLMYTFDENWNGRVVAEDKDDRLEHYLGQTFPASDVPKQARELYLKNPYRLIPNRNYKPSRLYPVINQLSNSFTDLSSCNLRGVPGVHLEYMGNMGINASMSIRVIKNGQLWALISCHNIEPKYLDYEICAVFEWLSIVISNRISLILNQEEYNFSIELQSKRTALTDSIYAGEDITEGLISATGPNILSLFNADGAAVVINGRVETLGSVPEKDDLENLLLWLEGKNVNKVFSTSNLPGLYGDAEAYTHCGSGILVIPIDSERGDYVICFRPEVVETIDWGGNPNEAINFEPDGKSYHPRNSFKLWKERLLMHSEPWNLKELEVADSLRNFLFEFRTRQLYS